VAREGRLGERVCVQSEVLRMELSSGLGRRYVRTRMYVLVHHILCICTGMVLCTYTVQGCKDPTIHRGRQDASR
jgi:hypothetical protein